MYDLMCFHELDSINYYIASETSKLNFFRYMPYSVYTLVSVKVGLVPAWKIHFGPIRP